MTQLIRPLKKEDLPKIILRYSFPWSTPEKTQTHWETYLQEQMKGKRTVAVIENKGEILGYGSFLRQSENPSFVQANIPEINDLWIDEKVRKQGHGKNLIQWIENLAQEEGYPQIGIGVGLYEDYGPAQRLYVQLGYLPTATGITYKGIKALPGKPYLLDDHLLLWLVKTLEKK